MVAIKRIRTTDPGATEGRLLFVVNWLSQFAEQLSGS
jgi:hypothetical protein